MPQECVWGQANFDVRVHWSKDAGTGVSDVNVAVDLKRGDSTHGLVTQLYGSTIESRRQVGEEIIAHLRGADISSIDAETVGDIAIAAFEKTGAYQAVWATLDRNACNRLIRMVRRARDDAYGRDE